MTDASSQDETIQELRRLLDQQRRQIESQEARIGEVTEALRLLTEAKAAKLRIQGQEKVRRARGEDLRAPKNDSISRGGLLKVAAAGVAGVAAVSVLGSTPASADQYVSGILSADFLVATGVSQGGGQGIRAYGGTGEFLVGVDARGSDVGVSTDGGNRGLEATSLGGDAVYASGANGVHAIGGAWNGDPNNPQGYGVYSVAASDSSHYGEAVHGHAPGLGSGVVGDSESAYGVWGASQTSDGVHGASQSGDGVRASSGSGRGVYASSVSGDAIRADSTAGTGIFATGNGTGVIGESAGGEGVFGRGSTYGVSGQSSGGYAGVFGTSSGEGVHGRSTGSGPGVGGDSSSGPGVFGNSQNEGVRGTCVSGVGVHGVAAKGRGGVFAGPAAQIQLIPAVSVTHPKSGLAGDLFLDKGSRLWLCVKSGKTATWREVKTY